MQYKDFWILWSVVTLCSLATFALGLAYNRAPTIIPALYALVCCVLVLYVFRKGMVYKRLPLAVLGVTSLLSLVSVFMETGSHITYFFQAPLYVGVSGMIISLLCVAGARLEYRLTTVFGFMISGAVSSSVMVATHVLYSEQLHYYEPIVGVLELNHHMVEQVVIVVFLSLFMFLVFAHHMAKRKDLRIDRAYFVTPKEGYRE